MQHLPRATHPHHNPSTTRVGPSETPLAMVDCTAPRRRALLAAAAAALFLRPATSLAAVSDVSPPTIDLSLAPDQSLYDAADPRLRKAAQLVQDALGAGDVRQEEALWTQIIKDYGSLVGNSETPWAADVVGRAWGNRGNARARQGRLDEALSDYNTSIKMCPWSVDPVLNRGATLEALGRFPEAVVDYRAVLKAAPNDPAGWNNLGNASAGMGDWATASDCFGRAASLAPQFSFAAANKAVVDFQLGRDDVAFKELRSLLRKYPEFPDARAALAAALWDAGLQAQAEDEWGRVNDPRYRDLTWLKVSRRWPPRLVGATEAFLTLKDVKK
jgi:tetratricopeptide (TPR) repeat protein